MLIIAQPKSASTSFSDTLAEMLRYHLIKITFFNADKCEGFEILQKCHTNMNKRNKKQIETMINDKIIYREHLLPTREHKKIIEKCKSVNKNIIVLLRNPEHSFDSYIRMFNKNKNYNINRKQLREDLYAFYNGWIKEGLYTIFYKDLVLDYEYTMKELLFFLKKEVKIIPLKRIKYTGIGMARLVNNCTT